MLSILHNLYYENVKGHCLGIAVCSDNKLLTAWALNKTATIISSQIELVYKMAVFLLATLILGSNGILLDDITTPGMWEWEKKRILAVIKMSY